jgi:DNA-binding CsgD family transcriptional regulator
MAQYLSNLQDLEKEISLLKEKCAFLEKVVNEVPANIYVSDLEKGVVWCNNTNEVTLGYKLEEIKAMGGWEYFNQIVHPEDQNIPEDSLRHYKSFSGEEFGGIFRARHKDATEYRWYLGWAKAFRQNEQGEVRELICVDVDMSARMNTEFQLEAALKENLKLKNKLLIKGLRKREVEVLTLISQGLQTKTIANLLSISILTVQTHRRNIQVKLGTNNIAEMVTIAKQAGLG